MCVCKCVGTHYTVLYMRSGKANQSLLRTVSFSFSNATVERHAKKGTRSGKETSKGTLNERLRDSLKIGS